MGGVKYMTKAYINKIRRVEIVRETERTIVFKDTFFKRERRASKESSNENYHDTWDEAKDYLVAREERKIARLKSALQEARSALGQLRSMKKPDDA